MKFLERLFGEKAVREGKPSVPVAHAAPKPDVTVEKQMKIHVFLSFLTCVCIY